MEKSPNASKLNIKIVTLAQNIPGPVAVAKLAELGAKVIKIEPPEGDPLKRYSPEWYEKLISGQEVVNLNLKTESDRQKLDDYLEKFDLLITSMRPQSLKRLNLHQESLRKKFPHLSHIEIIGYSKEKENMAGHDLTYQAELGLLSPPLLPKILLADMMAAEKVFSAVLWQVISQNTTHQRISISESLNDCLLPIKLGLTTDGGLLGGGFAGYNLYQTTDGWIALAALEPHFWQELLANLDEKNADIPTLRKIFRTKSSTFWLEWGSKLNLPIAIVN